MKLPLQVDLTGKVAIVTGGGGVLCSVFAGALARYGAKTAILDINLEAAQKVADDINRDGFIAKAYQTDVLDKTAVENSTRQIQEEFGSCDILINGAGGHNAKATTDNEFCLPGDTDRDMNSFFNLDTGAVDRLIRLNYMGIFIPSQVISKDMAAKGSGVIINITSMNAFRPLTKIPAYSAAKAAVSNFTQWMAVHFAKAGIRVNAIAPGFFVTPINRYLLYNADSTPTARTSKILNNTPMGRFGESGELLGTLLFLVSEAAAGFITGVVIPVDGGFNAYSGV